MFEWPLFAAYAVYMWWRFVHEAAPDASPPEAAAADPGGPDAAAAGLQRRPEAAGAEDEKEDAELAAYNDYLAQLAEQDKATGR